MPDTETLTLPDGGCIVIRRTAGGYLAYQPAWPGSLGQGPTAIAAAQDCLDMAEALSDELAVSGTIEALDSMGWRAPTIMRALDARSAAANRPAVQS